MRAVSREWGVPDFGVVLLRQRLAKMVDDFGSRPVVIYGPAGCGKSVLASQVARSCEALPIWLDAGGVFVDAGHLANSLAGILGGSTSHEVEGLDNSERLDVFALAIQALASPEVAHSLVVDDLGSPEGVHSFDGFPRLLKMAWQASIRVVISTRSVEHWPPDLLCECVLIGPDELALTDDEAIALADPEGAVCPSTEAIQLREACGGHIALYVVLLSQARRKGLEALAERTASLDAWLARMINMDLGSEARNTLWLSALLRWGDSIDLSHLRVTNPERQLRVGLFEFGLYLGGDGGGGLNLQIGRRQGRQLGQGLHALFGMIAQNDPLAPSVRRGIGDPAELEYGFRLAVHAQ